MSRPPVSGSKLLSWVYPKHMDICTSAMLAEEMPSFVELNLLSAHVNQGCELVRVCLQSSGGPENDEACARRMQAHGEA